jgi:phenylpropionate dioxygenase-like ring-hydroxylating dioxygenase large terminal subunit
MTDPRVWEVEQERVFAAHWVAVARNEDLTHSGDFVTSTIGHEPVVVVRSSDGTLRALSNVCRHRGTTLVEGSGNERMLRCPNHRWTYQLDGSLVAAPSMDEVTGFSKSTMCLPSFAVCEWQGWVMVNTSGTAAPLSVELEQLDHLLADAGLATMVRVGSLPFPSPWNWKISVENFAESYHHQSVHPDTLQPTFPGARSFVVDSGGKPWTWLDHVSTEPTLEPFTATVVFPTLMFSWIRPNAMAWFRVEPSSAAETQLTIELFVQPDDAGNAELVELMLASLHQINSEDIDINRRTFAGLKSRHFVAGPLSVLEGAVAHFREWIVEQLKS